MKKAVLPIFLATLWIGFSEFLRNQIIVINMWRKHYENLGLTFPETIVNGMIWMVWSLILAVCIWYLLKKLSLRETVILSWVMAFVLMWLTIGNLAVLPFVTLLLAVPLSLLEVFVAALIIKKMSGEQ